MTSGLLAVTFLTMMAFCGGMVWVVNYFHTPKSKY